MALSSCPNCGAGWKEQEAVSAAHHGGGYHVLCHNCEHKYDDVQFSYGERQSEQIREARMEKR